MIIITYLKPYDSWQTNRYYYIIIIIVTPLEFFTSALAGGLSL